jgi:uncharacterized protein YuzE
VKVGYDAKHDLASIGFSRKKPDGAIEINEGVVLDSATENAIVYLEIFGATSHGSVDARTTLG